MTVWPTTATADGSPAVRLGMGTAAISPDGKSVLLASNYVSCFPRLGSRRTARRTRRDFTLSRK
jgi:hypothetical protein